MKPRNQKKLQALSFKSCIYAVFISLIFVFFSVCTRAQAATLYAGSAYQTVEEGQTFLIDWFLDTEGKEINTVALNLRFTKETLEAVEVGTGQSLISLWTKIPEFSNTEGTVKLAGGFPGGVAGKKIPIAYTVFQAKASGVANITMEENSAVFLNDGRGTPDQLVFQVLNFPVGPKGLLPIPIISPTHPNPDSWYRENRVMIKFNPQSGEDYSYSFSSNPEIFPDSEKDQFSGELVYENLPDGIYYFKLNSKISLSNWQEAGIFRVQIDSTPPEKFQPLITATSSVFAGQPFLSFSTVDKTSGISHYKVKNGIIRGAVERLSPYKLPFSVLGRTIEVEAWDRAGNIQKVKVIYPGSISWQVLAGIAGILVLIIGTSFLLFRKKFRKSKAVS